MSNKNNKVKRTIIDDVEVIEEDGVTRFIPLPKKDKKIEIDHRSTWNKICDWFKNGKVTPYVKIRDLADPTGDRARDSFDSDVGSDGKQCGEIGIRIRF